MRLLDDRQVSKPEQDLRSGDDDDEPEKRQGLQAPQMLASNAKQGCSVEGRHLHINAGADGASRSLVAATVSLAFHTTAKLSSYYDAGDGMYTERASTVAHNTRKVEPIDRLEVLP